MKFTVVYEPDEGGWHASIPQVQGCRTWGRTLSTARRHIREALATCVDEFDDPDRVAAEADLVDEVRLPTDVQRLLARQRAAQERAAQEEAKLRVSTETAATALAQYGVSLRDAATLLGLSHQRVHQILPRPKSRAASPVAKASKGQRASRAQARPQTRAGR